MPSSVRQRRRQCGVPGCMQLGRLFPAGWLCEAHSRPQPTPDPARTLEGLQRDGHRLTVVRAVVSALSNGLSGDDVADAVAAGGRQYALRLP